MLPNRESRGPGRVGVKERTGRNKSNQPSEADAMQVTSFLRRISISPLPIPASWYAVPLRLIVGLGFVAHGYAKLSRGADAFIAILHAIGMPFADLFGWATIAVEIIGGLLILVGAFVPIAAVPMTIVLLVAIVTVHLPNGFSSIKLMSYDAAGAHFGQPGYETDLLYLTILVALCIGGAGPLSVDGFLSARRKDAMPAWRGGALHSCPSPTVLASHPFAAIPLAQPSARKSGGGQLPSSASRGESGGSRLKPVANRQAAGGNQAQILHPSPSDAAPRGPGRP